MKWGIAVIVAVAAAVVVGAGIVIHAKGPQ